ncbi:MAG: tetratricopeptide repeat protein, partial [Defluviitaleaceae bacterium]|nr:tetratricopeptide repeat protein [Defluviitaleaceae bacterium]
MANLIQTIGQEIENAGYEFRMTRIRCYSFEEAQYHCFRYWRQSIGEFLGADFLAWVAGALELANMAEELRKIDPAASLYERLSGFLTLGGYFDPEDLGGLQDEVAQWESRTLWEQFKERGDFWAGEGDFERALVFYRQGLDYDARVELLNNAGAAHLRLGEYNEAAGLFARARLIAPDNMDLRLNLIESLVIGGDHEAAAAEISAASNTNPNEPELLYFRAEIDFQNKNYSRAISILSEACELKYEPQFIYRLADCYIKIRLYDKALDALATVQEQDGEFLRRQAAVLAAANNLPMAIKALQKAISHNSGDTGLWVTLAQY